MEPVGKTGRTRLRQQAFDIEAGDLTGGFGRGSFRIIEVRRHRDHRALDIAADAAFGFVDDMFENQAGELLREVLLAGDGQRLLASHLPFDLRDRALGVLDGEIGGRLADVDLAVLGELHHRGDDRFAAVAGRDHLRIAAGDVGDRAACRPQIDPNGVA